MRLSLTKESRTELFDALQKHYNVKTLNELATKFKVPFKTLEKWRYGERYIPSHIIPASLKIKGVVDTKPDQWGRQKGGSIGGKKAAETLRKKVGESEYRKIMSKRGKKVINHLRVRYTQSELAERVKKGKLAKREVESRALEAKHESFFTNNSITLKGPITQLSNKDKTREIKFPKAMSAPLAEEIGIHLGDGCLSSKNYFSVKSHKEEKAYFDFMYDLYHLLYGIKIQVKEYERVWGFEVYSKGLTQFKTQVLGLPIGEKVERIRIPEVVLATKNKEVYRAIIRGLFDTDGNIYHKKKNLYPVISITIKSKELIQQLRDMFLKLGFMPVVYKWTIILNGEVMCSKWIREIGSNNPKKKKKLLTNALVV